MSVKIDMDTRTITITEEQMDILETLMKDNEVMENTFTRLFKMGAYQLGYRGVMMSRKKLTAAIGKQIIAGNTDVSELVMQLKATYKSKEV